MTYASPPSCKSATAIVLRRADGTWPAWFQPYIDEADALYPEQPERYRRNMASMSVQMHKAFGTKPLGSVAA